MKPPTIYLKPGEIYCGNTPAVVTTLLGSCVSVTMYHEDTNLYAICHGLLPTCRGDDNCNGTCLEGLKYIDCSIKRMLKQFDDRGIKRTEIEVKVFGGANMLHPEFSGSWDYTVGKENVLIAVKTITEEGLKIKASDTGGQWGRKIFFITDTGEVFLKKLHGSGATP
ncbi:MAG: chemotaxis protein CheD [Nitrospirales bacterium]|nr:chemotaxis protein CheD [Nitrospirales bacterium]